MEETPAGLQHLTAMIAAFREIGASSVHIISVDSDVTVFVHATGDEGTARMAQSMGLPPPSEHVSTRNNDVRHRWVSTSGSIAGVRVNVSSEHSVTADQDCQVSA